MRCISLIRHALGKLSIDQVSQVSISADAIIAIHLAEDESLDGNAVLKTTNQISDDNGAALSAEQIQGYL